MAYENLGRPRFVVPALGGLYVALETYSWPLVRVATGLFFVPASGAVLGILHRLSRIR